MTLFKPQSDKENDKMTKMTKKARFLGRKFAALLAVAVSLGGGTFAGEVWDGNNLTIFGR